MTCSCVVVVVRGSRPRRKGLRRGRRAIRPDGELVAGRVGEVESAPAGERVDRLEDRPAGLDLGVASQAPYFLAAALNAGSRSFLIKLE